MRWPWEHAKAEQPDKRAWMRDVCPGDKEALVIRVEGDVITVRPVRPEYLVYVASRAGYFFEGKVAEGSDTFVGVAIKSVWPLDRYRDDPAVWAKALDLFRPQSGQALTLRDLDNLGHAWLESVLTRDEYHKYRVMMR
jgi:hypothetical protein